MKGIILAGGLGTRLRPLTLVTNKHLLPVYDQPMVYYPIQCLVNAGIRDILVVTGGGHAEDFDKALVNSKELGIDNLEFAYQQGEGGIADALKLAEKFSQGDKICVVLGDNIIEGNIRQAVEDFTAQPTGAKLLLKEVPDPERFGVAVIDGEGSAAQIREIVEKPTNPESHYAVTGLYCYDSDVFDLCKTLKPSARGELEITDLNNAYLKRGDLTFEVLEGWWTDAGTIESLYRATTLVAEGGANHLDLPQTSSASLSHSM
jgi:glucose-1-phosphate thymidylyltransferase